MDQNQILLSVIVPVYNEEQYITKCVKSILKQEDISIEIILVDDGSTDQSKVLCDLLAEENPCVRVLHTDNGGISKARRQGVQMSTGRWVTFVDADDWIAEGAYEDILTDSSNDLVVTGICRYFEEEYQIFQVPCFESGIYDRETILQEILPVMLWDPSINGWRLDPSLCTKIFKRDIILEYLEKASVVGCDFGEDSIVTFPMMLHINQIRITKKIYYYHRQRKGNVIAQYIRDEKFIEKLYNAYRYLEGQFRRTPFWDIMKNQLDCFFINGIEIKKRCYRYSSLEFSVYFPIEKIPKGSRVVLYGAGTVGRQYWMQNMEYHFCEIVLWVDLQYKDKQPDESNQLGVCKIENPATIKTAEFDFVLIAVDQYDSAKEIVRYLAGCKVGKEKIVWHSVRADHREFEGIEEE